MKVISGGQTGVDRMGLEIAKSLGIETGGSAPKGWKTENGSDPTLRDFGLIQHISSDYKIRTIENIRNSDATIVFGDVMSAGTALTVKLAGLYKKPLAVNPSEDDLFEFLERNEVKILNVAGNRASKISKEKLEEASKILTKVLTKYK